MIICIVTVCCFLAICVYLRTRRVRPSNEKVIPLEKGLPIIGVAVNIKESLCNYLFKLSQKHGPIYQVRFGMRNIVVLNTFEYLKVAMIENGHALSGRWKIDNDIFVTDNAGLFFLDGKVWAEQRAFVLRALKDSGFGRSRSLEIVQDECALMLEGLEQVKGQRFNLTRFLSLHTLNVLSKFVMNKRFSREDPEFHNIENYVTVVISDNDPLPNFLLMFPCLDNQDWLIKFIIWITSRKSLGQDFHHLIANEVKEHSSRLDVNSEGNDLIDKFLIKQHRMKEENGNVGTFTEWQLITNVFDLLIAGIETTSIGLVWGCVFMSMHPEVQDKVHQEIVDKIGHERMPSMADKVSLVYTQAVMDEISRLSSIAPLSDRHRVLTNINVKGYFIPANTIIIPNLFACHLDPNVWKKPFEFYPEHFLLTDSNGEMKYRPREELIPFSIGKRQCIGESLANLEFFIFFVSLLQRYQVGMVTERSYFDVFCGKDGIVRRPDVEEFTFRDRR